MVSSRANGCVVRLDMCLIEDKLKGVEKYLDGLLESGRGVGDQLRFICRGTGWNRFKGWRRSRSLVDGGPCSPSAFISDNSNSGSDGVNKVRSIMRTDSRQHLGQV